MSLTLDLQDRAKTYVCLSANRHLLWNVRRVDTSIIIKKDGTGDGKPERTAHCMLTPTGVNASLDYDYGNHQARYGGLQTCTSVWACPRCSWVIGRGRRDELVKVSAVMEEDYYVLFVTFTVSHNAHHFLMDSVTALSSALGKFRGGKAWNKFRQDTGYTFDVQSFEVTWGLLNGWHPHKHWLVYFLKSTVDSLVYVSPAGEKLEGLPALLVMVQEFFVDRWLHTLVADDYGFSASRERGVVVKHSPSDISEYIAKFGYIPGAWRVEDELTRSAVKKGRSIDADRRYTPFQLLEEYALQGSDWAAEKWLEFVFTMKGKQQLRYMRGFKPFLKGMGLDIKTDAELAEEEGNSAFYDCLALFNLSQWRQIIQSGIQPILLDYVEAVQGDRQLVTQFLIDNGVDMTVSV